MNVIADSDIVRILLPTPLPIGPVNAFLVKSDPPILVDAGSKMDEGYEQLQTRLKEHGLQVRDLGAVLITHGHLDHIGLAGRILNESNAQAYAHPSVVKAFSAIEKEMPEGLRFLLDIMRRYGVPGEIVQRVQDERASLRAFTEPVAIQHAVQDGEAAAGFTAYHVPGHSAGDVVFYHPGLRVAFTGDHVLKGVSPNPIIRRASDGVTRCKSLVEYQHSLRRTHALDIETCYPGHGGPFNNHRAIIDHLLERHEHRTAEVRALLEHGPMAPYEIVEMLYPKMDPKFLHLGLSTAIGHLDVLEERGQVILEEQDGVVRYAIAPSISFIKSI